MDFPSEFHGCVNADAKCEIVQKLCRPERDEPLSFSLLSPGPVQNEELLARFIYEPTHFSGNLFQYEAVFFDLLKRGLSVTRESSSADIHAVGNSHANARIYRGFIRCQAGQLRESLLEGSRVFVIFDTAMPENIAHADVFCLLDRTRRHQVKLIIKKVFSGALTNDLELICP